MPELVDGVLDPKEGGPVKKGISAVLDCLKTGDRPNKFPVIVFDDKVLLFRYPKTSGDANHFNKAAVDFMMRMRADPKGLPKPYQEALSVRDLDDDDLVNAYVLHYWSHEEDKIDETQALQMVAWGPAIVLDIVSRIDKEIHNGTRVISFGGVVDQKKDLSPIGSRNSGSKRRSSTAKDTRTS